MKSPHSKTNAPLTAGLLASAIAALFATPEGFAQAPVTDPPAKAADADTARKLKPIVVEDTAEREQGKDALRATTTQSAKGNQALRDVPQSVTVVTEKLLNDRRIDTVKEALTQTAGVTFLAAEGGEEDIRLRGFSLAATGDIYLDGMRDAAFYDRDTFNLDRIDLIRGSASMLFGRGSTGGVANQVSKAPGLLDEGSLSLTVGNFAYRRALVDLNRTVAKDSALRLTLMKTQADNNGAGSSLDKQGGAIAFHHGIGHRHEWQAKFFFLDNDNGVNYGLPWIRPNSTAASDQNTIIPGLKPEAYFGLASDYSAGSAKITTLGHVLRMAADSELKTQVRVGDYTRDLRASAIRFSGGNAVAANTLVGLGPTTVFTRGTNLKVQDLETSQVQSDFSSKFAAFGLRHHLLAGIDWARDERVVYAARNAAQGGVTLTKPTALVGSPDDGAAVQEGSRVFRRGNDFIAKSLGVYVQDNAEVAKHVKLVVGLRYDRLEGAYNVYALPNNAPTPITTTSYRQDVSETSHRLGLLFQPSDRHSFHVSWGTSFNTSGDTYSYNALSANTPPESSENLELGGRIESANKRLTTRFALFRSTKKNERNTDPDTAATRLLLSGKRHASGVELDVAGRISNSWEVYLSAAYIPTARVDAASTATTVGNRVGDRPGLTPRFAGTAWTTYQCSPKLRVGGGLNHRGRQAPADVTASPWEAPAFTTGDLFAEYTLDSSWTLKLNANNITNKYYADTLYRGHYIPGAGRLVQGTVVVNF
jgi:catecholate siderophore receptor